MNMLSSAYSIGEYEKVLKGKMNSFLHNNTGVGHFCVCMCVGIYENYLEVKVRDPDLNFVSLFF